MHHGKTANDYDKQYFAILIQFYFIEKVSLKVFLTEP